MNKVGIPLAAVSMLASRLVCAQSSVTLFGILDTNIEDATNVGGASGRGNRVSMSTTGGPTGNRDKPLLATECAPPDLPMISAQ